MTLLPRARTSTAHRRRLHRAVRWTARASGLLFAAALATSVTGPRARRASPWLYAGFVTVHAVHFSAVVRFARVTGGQGLFPGGRSLGDMGGWPTVAAIYSGFGALVGVGRFAVGPPGSSGPRRDVAGRAAVGVIGLMFVGTYLGQLRRSRLVALPATLIGAAVTARIARGAGAPAQGRHGADARHRSPLLDGAGAFGRHGCSWHGISCHKCCWPSTSGSTVHK